MLLAVAVQHFRTYTLVREAARLERHRDDLVLGNAALRVEIQRLRTDDRYIERLAREQLGMLRPGEMELVVIPTADQHPTGQDPTTARARQHGGARDRSSRSPMKWSGASSRSSRTCSARDPRGPGDHGPQASSHGRSVDSRRPPAFPRLHRARAESHDTGGPRITGLH